VKKEINLFEQEVESVPRGTYVQAALPGILEELRLTQEKKAQDVQMRLQVKRTIEALLFASSEPLSFDKMREVTDTVHPFKPRVLKELIEELREEYISQQRAFRLEEIAQGFILRTCEEFGPRIELLYRNKRSEKLTHPAAEVLAIIAYKQPITRPQIDAIRGVDSSGTLQNLLERQLVEPVGKLEAPGRPILYGITPHFLKHFGLREIGELTASK
jgi:segregation and condensation protein B